MDVSTDGIGVFIGVTGEHGNLCQSDLDHGRLLFQGSTDKMKPVRLVQNVSVFLQAVQIGVRLCYNCSILF